MQRILWIVFLVLFNTNLFAQKEYILSTLKDHSAEVLSVAFSPDGNELLTGSSDNTFILWDWEKAEKKVQVEGHFRPVMAVDFTKDGHYLITAGDRSLKLWNKDGTLVRQIGVQNTDIWSFSLSPDSKYVAYGSYGREVKIDPVFQDGEGKELDGHKKSTLSVSYSPDGKYIATGSLDKTIKLWDAATDKLIRTYHGHAGNIFDIAFSPDSKNFASASLDKTIKLWSIDTTKSIHTFKGHQQAVRTVCFSTDGRTLLSGSYDQTIRLWDISTGKEIYSYIDHDGVINDIAINPNGENFAGASSDGTVIIWKLAPEIFAEHFFHDDMQHEMDTSGLFLPKQKNESRADYKLREEKASEFRKKLVRKYFEKYRNQSTIH
ncbi:MAG TPA: WD40 repeat domain-containing protein [Bacteroidales bacterium]|nr:WD40 repeat domain-containing protein [Bacteroidales bacterium]